MTKTPDDPKPYTPQLPTLIPTPMPPSPQVVRIAVALMTPEQRRAMFVVIQGGKQ